jgi:ATPase, P-type (transporting), HAD superfamily, subfamily IC
VSANKKQKFISKGILKSSILGAVVKLNPLHMRKNPVMFVVEAGFLIVLLLCFFPDVFGDGENSLQAYNVIVSSILLATLLFANFAEAVAEGRGKAQAQSLKKTQKDMQARILGENGTEKAVSASMLKKGDLVLVKAGELIPNDGEVVEGIASVDESAITGESAPV